MTPSEYLCKGCQGWILEDDVVWVTLDGIASTELGYPWHVGCAPDEPEDTPPTEEIPDAEA